MKLIESVVFAIGLLYMGSHTLEEVHDTVRKVVLKRVARGLPPLIKFKRPRT